MKMNVIFKRLAALTMAAVMLTPAALPIKSAKAAGNISYYVNADFDNGEMPFNTRDGIEVIQNETGYCIEMSSDINNKYPEIKTKTDGSFTLEFSMTAGKDSYPYVYLQFDDGDYVEFFNVFYPQIKSATSDNRYWSCVPMYGPFGEYNEKTVDMYYTLRNQWVDWRFDFDKSTGLVTTYINGEKITKYYSNQYITQKPPIWKGSSLTGVKFSLGSTQNTAMKLDNIKIYKTPAEENAAEKQDDEYENLKNKLAVLGVLSESFLKNKVGAELKRQEFVDMAVRLAGYTGAVSQNSRFEDVLASNKYYSSINYADENGYISDSDDKIFRPAKYITFIEAASILTNILDYKKIVEISGGYPNGVTQTQIYKDLIKGISVENINQRVTMKDAVKLIDNALTIPVLNANFTGDKIEYSYDGTKTLLEKNFDMEQVLMRITDVDRNNRSISVTDEKTNQTDKYNLSDTVSELNAIGTKQYILVKDGTVIYMYPYKNSTVKYGYVSSYNKDLTPNSVSVKELKKLAFSNYDGTAKVSDTAKLFINGIEMSRDEKVNLTGSCVRYCYENGEIVRIYVIGDASQNYIPSSGGIITSINKEKIRYAEYGSKSKFLDSLEQYDSVITVIDGRETEFSQLKKEMVIDYAVSQNCLYIYSTRNTYSGKLKSVSSDELKLENDTLSISSKPIYVSKNNGEEYSDGINLNTLASAEIKVFTDMSCAVRYIIVTGDNGEYIAVVQSAYESDDGEKMLKVYVISDNNLELRSYEYKSGKKTIYDPYINYEEAAQNAKKTDGSGIYRIQVRNSKIKSIKKPEWSKEYTGAGTIDRNYKRIRVRDDNNNYDYINVNTDNFLVLPNYNGDFEPQLYTYKSMVSNSDENSNSNSEVARNFSEVVMKYIKFENDDFVKPELLLIKNNTDSIYSNLNYFGAVTDKSAEWSDERECVIYKYKISWMYDDKSGSSDIVSTQELVDNDGNPVEMGNLIMYNPNSLYEETGKIRVNGLFNSEKIFDQSWRDQSFGNYSVCYAGKISAVRDGYILVTDGSGDEKWIQMSNYIKLFTTKDGKTLEACEAANAIGKQLYTVKSSDKKSYPSGLIILGIIPED